MRRFDKVKPSAILPTRATKYSAGYDFYTSEDIVVKSSNIGSFDYSYIDAQSLKDGELLLKKLHIQPTLIPTGIAFKGEPNDVLLMHSRSGIAIKNLLMLPNAVRIIDSDYYPREIMVPVINLAPFDIVVPKGTRIAQGIISTYLTVDDEPKMTAERTGGFGSTGK